MQMFEFAYSAPPLFFPLVRFKIHHCIVLYIRKVLKNGKRLVAHRYSLRKARFAKYRFSNVHILHFRCFSPCFGYRTEEYLICSFQNMFIHFVSFRSAKYSKASSPRRWHRIYGPPAVDSNIVSCFLRGIYYNFQTCKEESKTVR